MAKRGPKSSAETNIVTLATRAKPRLTPPTLLSKPERSLFVQIVANSPHLRPMDVPMLATYVQGLAKTYRLAKKSDADSLKAWNDTSRVVLALARSLRLTTQSQLGKGTAARATENGTPLSYYARAAMEDADD